MVRRKGKKEITSPPVEREDNCECLEMLRWTEAVSSTNTAPASVPTPSHSLTDFSVVSVCMPVCVFRCVCVMWMHIIMHTVGIPFLFQPIR